MQLFQNHPVSTELSITTDDYPIEAAFRSSVSMKRTLLCMWMVYSRATTSWMAERPDFCLDDISTMNGAFVRIDCCRAVENRREGGVGLTEGCTVS